MATFDYAKMAATAARLLEKFGSTVTVKRETGGSVDPVSGVVTSGSQTTYSPNGVLTKFPDNLIDGTRIQASDRKLILDDTIAPLLTDKVTIQGEDWTLQEIMTVNPAGTAIIYECVARR